MSISGAGGDSGDGGDVGGVENLGLGFGARLRGAERVVAFRDRSVVLKEGLAVVVFIVVRWRFLGGEVEEVTPGVAEDEAARRGGMIMMMMIVVKVSYAYSCTL